MKAKLLIGPDFWGCKQLLLATYDTITTSFYLSVTALEKQNTLAVVLHNKIVGADLILCCMSTAAALQRRKAVVYFNSAYGNRHATFFIDV